jgi:DNA-binding NarL/FixJ family response regulator
MSKIFYIIEDDDLFFALMSNMLSDFKAQLFRFKSFDELKASALLHKPDLAIVDYFLADNFSKTENGLVATDFLKKKFPDLKIIVLSGQIQPEITYDFIFKYRVDAYINKDKNALILLMEKIEKLFF